MEIGQIVSPPGEVEDFASTFIDGGTFSSFINASQLVIKKLIAKFQLRSCHYKYIIKWV